MLGAASPGQFPADQGIEVAIAGRSNAGKSSALNTITGRKGLARTSKTPGRTRELNFFLIDTDRRLVDLPGYGYAKVPESVKQTWHTLIDLYLRMRQSLRGMIIVMDCRHPLTEFDLQMLDWCRHRKLLVHILLTKSDKLSRGAANSTLHKVRQSVTLLLNQGEVEGAPPRCSVQLFSALKRTGVEEAHAVLDQWLEYEKKKAPVKKVI